MYIHCTYERSWVDYSLPWIYLFIYIIPIVITAGVIDILKGDAGQDGIQGTDGETGATGKIGRIGPTGLTGNKG